MRRPTDPCRWLDVGMDVNAPESLSPLAYPDFECDAGTWDVIVFNQTGRHIDALELFSKASALLKPDGEIVIADTFLLHSTSPHPEPFYHLDHLVSMGSRFGFELIDRHEPEQIWPDADQTSRPGSADSSLTHAFLRLRRTRLPPWTPGWIRPQHAAQVRALFADIFGHEMSPDMWAWKYGHGRGQAVGVWQAGRLVAHYGGLTRAISFFGDPRYASQSSDVMAQKGVRQSLGRQSPFLAAAASYLESCVGYGRHHLLGVGFPNRRARRAPELLGLYRGPVGSVQELAWQVSGPTIGRRFAQTVLCCRPLDLLKPSDAELVDDCWLQMQRHTKQFILGVRDAAWLRCRYAQHPAHRYEMLAVTLRGLRHPLGIVVLRWHADGRCEWMDMVGLPSRAGWMLAGIQRHAAQRGAEEVFAWVSDALLPFLPSASRTLDLQIGIPANGWTSGPSAETLMGRWWLMGGDTDFK